MMSVVIPYHYMLTVVMLNVIMVDAAIPNNVILSVFIAKFTIQSVVMQN
jgi:hypothetical protein